MVPQATSVHPKSWFGWLSGKPPILAERASSLLANCRAHRAFQWVPDPIDQDGLDSHSLGILIPFFCPCGFSCRSPFEVGAQIETESSV